MDNLIKKLVRCPQCGNLAMRHGNSLTTEHLISCPYCGYTEENTLTEKTVTKGYGALWIDDQYQRFIEPISYEKEMSILKSVEVKDYSFFKWDDQTGLTVIKGELSKELTEEEEKRMQDYIDEQTYYSSFEGSYPSDSTEYVDF